MKPRPTRANVTLSDLIRRAEMSSYGSQGGPPAGQPQDPWQAAADQSDVPHQWRGGSDRLNDWGSAPAPTELPPWQPPSYNDGAGVTWSPPAPAKPPKRHRGLIIAAAVVVLAGGAGGGYYYLSHSGGGRPGASAAPSRQPGQQAPAQSQPAPPSAPTPTPSATAGGSTTDVFAAKVGDCLANQGTDSAPKMAAATCGPGTYQVLKRLSGTIDKDQCNGVFGYTHNYFYDSPSNDKDFVLCLKQR
jgi:hypothetical protein